VFVVAGLGPAGRVSAGHHPVADVTLESPYPLGCHARDVSIGCWVPAPALAHHDGLIRSMSAAGIAVPVAWLVTGLPRSDFSPVRIDERFWERI
jgi:hypothetical protein